MEITERYFFQEDQQAVIHLPQRPNGFGILYIGGRSHYVENQESSLVQHVDQKRMINYLRSQGYTVFTCNFYGRHWGSEKAVSLAKTLYHSVMKQETLNPAIHIIGEDMGALLVCKLFRNSPIQIRSIVLLNPILNLQEELEMERKNILFYKRTLQEVLNAYQTKEISVALKQTCYFYENIIPIKIYSSTRNHYKWKNQIRTIEKERLNRNLDFSLLIFHEEKKYAYGKDIHQFFKLHQKIL
jgi:hypothetical protein